jgi:hypothetical protein
LNESLFHSNLYDLALIGTIFIGQTFAFHLWFVNRTDRPANRFLVIALVATVLWTFWPFFGLGLGPLLYFFVFKLTLLGAKIRLKHLLHFTPFLLLWWLDTQVVQALVLISVAVYLWSSRRLIEKSYRQQQFTGGDRCRLEWRWLQPSIKIFGLLCLLGLPVSLWNVEIVAWLAIILLIRLGALTLFRLSRVAPNWTPPSPAQRILQDGGLSVYKSFFQIIAEIGSTSHSAAHGWAVFFIALVAEELADSRCLFTKNCQPQRSTLCRSNRVLPGQSTPLRLMRPMIQ